MKKYHEILEMNKCKWEEVADRFYGRTALPEYGPFSFTEEELQLFGEISNRKVLDIGCGSGHSLQYMGDKGAKELWGLDLSPTQISSAEQLLQNQHAKVEENPEYSHAWD